MVNIEITEDALAQLLDYTMTGMEELGEVTPIVIEVFKELVNKLPETAWNIDSLKEFIANLEQEDDYPLMEEDDDDYDY